MKKLFILAFLLASFNFTLAIDINLSNSLRLSENQGIVQLPTVSINLDTTQINSFDLVLDSSEYLIFDTPSDIKLNNNSVKPTVSLDYKRLTFAGNFSGTIIIDGIKIRSYDQKIYGTKLGLNYLGDSTIDIYSTNVIQQDQDSANSDNMKPLPISNLRYSLNGNNISLTRNYSPDLDLISTIVEVYKNNGYLKYYTIGAKDTTTIVKDLDITKDSFKIAISAKDLYYMSDPTSVTIPKQIVVLETGSDTPNTTGSVKYIPTINVSFLNSIITKLDNQISKYTTGSDNIINKRNLFIQFLENFLTKKINATQFTSQLKNHVEIFQLYRKK